MTKSTLLTNKTFPLVLLGSAFSTLIGTPTMASTFRSEPIYQRVLSYETRIPATSSLTGFDDTDIYYPESSDPSATFPIALMLQGALVITLEMLEMKMLLSLAPVCPNLLLLWVCFS